MSQILAVWSSEPLQSSRWDRWKARVFTPLVWPLSCRTLSFRWWFHTCTEPCRHPHARRSMPGISQMATERSELIFGIGSCGFSSTSPASGFPGARTPDPSTEEGLGLARGEWMRVLAEGALVLFAHRHSASPKVFTTLSCCRLYILTVPSEDAVAKVPPETATPCTEFLWTLTIRLSLNGPGSFKLLVQPLASACSTPTAREAASHSDLIIPYAREARDVC
mmetsp:Transcript_47295/g.122661  ORF Transcript_47295/g.122661 Transcript_47295/m.122661 type:complete len:222 (-) Transcript_47295:33-698(-)